MQTSPNRRLFTEHYLKAQHAKLDVLRRSLTSGNKCLNKSDIVNNVYTYPRPEFHVSRLKHETNQSSVRGIWKDGGFKDPNGSKLPLVWFSLAVQPQDIQSAETRLLETTYPNRTEEQVAGQQSFLKKFATSPVFSEKSRYGSYRFTFPAEEVLKAYREQFCSGKQPVFRVLKTCLYKQEVLYAVLVHNPDNNDHFSEYPELTDDGSNAVCAYKDGSVIWRPEAMCGKHKYKLMQNSEKKLMVAEEPGGFEYYVWDHVALALHVENGKVLKFNSDQLREHIDVCEEDDVKINGNSDGSEDPEGFIKSLWPKWTTPSFVEKFAELSVHENPKKE